MKAQSSTVTEFTGLRIQVDTHLCFEEVRSRLRDFLGHTSISIMVETSDCSFEPNPQLSSV